MRGLRVTRGALWAGELGDSVMCLVPPSYQLREADAGDAESLAAAAGLSPETVSDRFRRGSRPFVAVHDGAVVAWIWTSRDEEYAPPLGVNFQFESDEAYGWGAGASPDHRGHGLFGALLRFTGQALACEGVRVMWGGILDSNLASQRSTAHAGWRPVLRTLALHVGNRPLLWCGPVRYADSRLVERAYVVVGRPRRRRRSR